MPQTRRGHALTNVEVVTFATWRLGALDAPVHLEEIAQTAHQLAPGAFRWDLDKYSDAVDKDKVRVSLTDAEKVGRGWVVSVGPSRRGKTKRTDYWKLTSRGAAWVLANEARLARAFKVPARQLKKAVADSVEGRIRASSLYHEFQLTGSVPVDEYAFTDLIEVSPDASNVVVARRFDQLRSQVVLLEDPVLLTFLDACAIAYLEMLAVDDA